MTPSASGRRPFGPFVGESDVLVMHSVVDILGLNPISRSVFDNAAAAVVGMARDAGRPVADLGGRTVGITMLGHTTPAVMRILEALREAGHEPVVFHANGVGGPAMEKLVAAGALVGVIDYTLSELANTIRDGLHATGPDAADRRRRARRAAGRRPGLRRLLQPGRAVDAAARVRGPEALLPQPGRDARPARGRRDGRARDDGRRAPERRDGARARGRADARFLARRRRGRRPLGPGGGRRVRGRARGRAARRDRRSSASKRTSTIPHFADLVAERYLALVSSPAPAA